MAFCNCPQQATGRQPVVFSSAQPSRKMQPQLTPHCTANQRVEWGQACHRHYQRVDMVVALRRTLGYDSSPPVQPQISPAQASSGP